MLMPKRLIFLVSFNFFPYNTKRRHNSLDRQTQDSRVHYQGAVKMVVRPRDALTGRFNFGAYFKQFRLL